VIVTGGGGRERPGPDLPGKCLLCEKINKKKIYIKLKISNF